MDGDESGVDVGLKQLPLTANFTVDHASKKLNYYQKSLCCFLGLSFQSRPHLPIPSTI